MHWYQYTSPNGQKHVTLGDRFLHPLFRVVYLQVVPVIKVREHDSCIATGKYMYICTTVPVNEMSSTVSQVLGFIVQSTMRERGGGATETCLSSTYGYM